MRRVLNPNFDANLLSRQSLRVVRATIVSIRRRSGTIRPPALNTRRSMKTRRISVLMTVLALCSAASAQAQSPSATAQTTMNQRHVPGFAAWRQAPYRRQPWRADALVHEHQQPHLSDLRPDRVGVDSVGLRRRPDVRHQRQLSNQAAVRRRSRLFTLRQDRNRAGCGLDSKPGVLQSTDRGDDRPGRRAAIGSKRLSGRDCTFCRSPI